MDTETRFAFGKNWRNFARTADDESLERGQESLEQLLETSPSGKTFLDIGCGSGLFTAAASRLGATVTSFDFDKDSVATTREVVERFSLHVGAQPSILQGSVLDKAFLEELGRFDIVYSWGVLHHTGSMWAALENVITVVKPGGLLAIALYNDQGIKSKMWRIIKRLYVGLPRLLRPFLLFSIIVPHEFALLMRDTLTLRPRRFVRRWTGYGAQKRGMSRIHNHIDWIGGYPFEVARPRDVVDFYTERGFTLQKLIPASTGLGNNQFVFLRTLSAASQHD